MFTLLQVIFPDRYRFTVLEQGMAHVALNDSYIFIIN